MWFMLPPFLVRREEHVPSHAETVFPFRPVIKKLLVAVLFHTAVSKVFQIRKLELSKALAVPLGIAGVQWQVLSEDEGQIGNRAFGLRAWQSTAIGGG
jgi:hypothetical protein